MRNPNMAISFSGDIMLAVERVRPALLGEADIGAPAQSIAEQIDGMLRETM